MKLKKRILVAPLNWGLGHATRCIPIINALIKNNYIPIIASDGKALDLIRIEFPELQHLELPSYGISYAKKKKNFKIKLIKDSPKVLKAIKAEKKLVKRLYEDNTIDGIISDNRLGVYNKNLPSVFLTHQINVLSGTTTWFSSKLHQNIIKKFDECWVPDQRGTPNLSGKLGHSPTFHTNLKYIGPISRFKRQNVPLRNDLLVLLSGPEPQRSILEKKLLEELKGYDKKVVLVKGIIEEKQVITNSNNLTIYNYMTSSELEKTINESATVLSRSGYTTIMDLAAIGKAAFFIPTPGQFEQEYLARILEEQAIVPFSSQEDFKLHHLDRVQTFSGLTSFDYELNYKKLFRFFEGK